MFTHGKRYSPIYGVWRTIKTRCLNPKHIKYAWYGGRGIKVCKRWMRFEHFYADMGDAPGPEYSIDRIDPNGHYEPGNCKWSTKHEQRMNQRPRKAGDTMAGKAAAIGISRQALYLRIAKLGSLEKALAQPKFKH